MKSHLLLFSKLMVSQVSSALMSKTCELEHSRGHPHSLWQSSSVSTLGLISSYDLTLCVSHILRILYNSWTTESITFWFLGLFKIFKSNSSVTSVIY